MSHRFVLARRFAAGASCLMRRSRRAPLHCVYMAARSVDAVHAAQIVKPAGIRIHRARTLDDLAKLLDVVQARIVLADLVTDEGSWKDVLLLLERRYPGSVLVAAANIDDAAVWEDVILAGGFDVVLKPFSACELLVVLAAAQRYLPLITPAAAHARCRAIMDAIRDADAPPPTRGCQPSE